jgi:NAD(P)-dependent dehydrogenase (short-subunit alcohol dehydrogenase family)
MLLSDRVIIVTGSTTGIGAAVVRRCVEEGARVLIHGRSRERAENLSHETGASTAYVIADLEDPDSPNRIVNAAIEAFGRVDGLVNNAALTTRGNLETTDLAHFNTLVAVNMRSPLFMIKEVVPHFREAGGGSVVNIGSVNAFCGEPKLLVYSMTKGALATMTRNLADTLGTENIRINQINAGWTITDNERKLKMEHGFPDGWETKLPPAYAPFGRIFYPEEVAGHVVYWLSDAAGPVSGSTFELEQYPMLGRNPNKDSDD